MIETRTTIGRGQVFKERKYVGSFYVSESRGNLAHSAGKCIRKKDRFEYRRIPVYLEDGQHHWYDALRGESGEVDICEDCPTPITDRSWVVNGACFDTKDERFFLNREEDTKVVIEEFCNDCPVVVECFEYAASDDRVNAGAIWGGMYFPKESRQRGPAIEQRRKELYGTGRTS